MEIICNLMDPTLEPISLTSFWDKVKEKGEEEDFLSLVGVRFKGIMYSYYEMLCL